MNVPRFLRRLFREPYDGLRAFRVVREGVLYRCGQPRPADLSALISKYQLRTVISLRGSRSQADRDGWEHDERAACDAAGVEFVSLPCNHKNPPSIEQLDRFLDVMRDPRRTPALIHCRIGQQRTGLFCALFRVHIEGATPEVALQEMDDLGFESGKRRHRKLLETYWSLVNKQSGEQGTANREQEAT